MFRDAFTGWGLPLFVRVDNGHPWGSCHDLPRDLALWLIGLGVAVHWNPAGRPQHNGKVERTNGVTQAWAEPGGHADREGLGAALADAARVQRERYRSIGGRTRLEAYPALRTNPRRYSRDWEEGLWDLARVDEFLGQQVWRRRADRIGQIWIYNRGKLLGKAYHGQDVVVRFQAEGRSWVVQDRRGGEIKRFAAPELSRDRILSLQVSHRRARG